MKQQKHNQNSGQQSSLSASGKPRAAFAKASVGNTTSVGSFRFLFILVPFLVRGLGLDCPVFL